jgi:hypothetical protein
MPPLAGPELEEAIASPVNLLGYRFEAGLLGTILQDVGNEPGCLPLLQFVLTKLWEHRDRLTHQLTLAKYRELGGVISGLDYYTEQLYQNFSSQKRDWVKRICLRLVRTGTDMKDTRQRQPKQKLLKMTGNNRLEDQQVINIVLNELINGRLLVTGRDSGGEAWVDLAHEALIDGWEQFKIWCQEDRELGLLIDRVEDNLREWLNHDKDDQFLMLWGLLAQVREKWLELEPYLPYSAKEFYQRSINYERQQLTLLSLGRKLLEDLKERQKELIDRVKDALKEWLRHEKDDQFLIIGGLLAQVREKWSELELYLQDSAQEFYLRNDILVQEQASYDKEIVQLKEQLQELEAQLDTNIPETEEFRIVIGSHKRGKESQLAEFREDVENFLVTLQLFEQRREIYRTASEWLDDNPETLERYLVEPI